MESINENSFVKDGWRLTNKKKIKSLDEYLSYIKYLQNKWRTGLWFRGVSNKDYELKPSIYRSEVWSYNTESAYNIYHQFVRRSRGINQKYESFDKWGWYQLQQHYGLPTRLLDWTEGSLIALYFAVRKIKGIVSPSVWIIDPFDLNRISASLEVLLYSDKLIQDERDEIINNYIIDDSNLPALPIGILPSYIDDRIGSQKSTFTIHGKLMEGFEEVHFNDNNFKCVQLLIDPLETIILKNKIISMGISEMTLFPDLEGLARELKDHYEMN